MMLRGKNNHYFWPLKLNNIFDNKNSDVTGNRGRFMAVIALEGMRFFAHHGLYEEEKLMGTHFVLDIEINIDVSFATTVNEHEVDKVIGTINYETVYEICRIEMDTPQKLLETVVKNIMTALKWQFQNIFKLRIKIKKLNPPLGGIVASSSVEVEEAYLKQCGRCGNCRGSGHDHC